MKKTKGVYVVIEGIEGTGKGTQVERLTAHLEKLGRKAQVVREPGGTEMGERLRTLLKEKGLERTPETEVMLFSAARHELVSSVIVPALKAGEVVISDRSFLSTVAYQAFGHKRHDLMPLIERLIKVAHKGAMPTISIVLDLNPKVSVKRALERNVVIGAGDRFDEMEQAFHKRVRTGYLKGAKKYPHAVVDAGGTIEEVEARIWKVINKKCGFEKKK